MKQNIVIIMPAFNEGMVIHNVIKELKEYSYTKIIVIDDGSSDDTFDQAKSTGAITVRHLLNRGKGATVKTGIEAAKSLHADVVVTFDADGQHNPKDIQSLVQAINDGYDIALGTRIWATNLTPFYKRIFSALGNVLLYLFYGIWVHDSQNGLRAYSKNAIQLLDTSSERYEFDSEVLREINRHKLPYTEVPVEIRYTTYSQKKKDRQHIVSAILTMTRLLLNL